MSDGVGGYCFARKATLMSVCMNSFVMKVVSLPVYVEVAHFRLAGWFSGCGGGR